MDEVIADDDVAVAAITLAELQVGVLLADGPRRDRRAAFVAGVIDTLPVVDYTAAAAAGHAELVADVRREGEPRGAHDLVIAATARASGRVVVTADRAAFESLPGVEVRFHR